MFFCRQQVRSLSHAHRTDLAAVKDLLKSFKCPGCKENSNASTATGTPREKPSVELKPIGQIRTEFAEKRAVPRQPSVCPKLLGCVELNKDVFNNPEHSLDGLNEFSHLWIIYHFHKNESHAKAKVAPPRLSGERVGIFSTRSPHRPCPIGLSLVEIERIDGKNVYFHGTDMVDGTPVLDLKPYIPRYDNPVFGGLGSAMKHPHASPITNVLFLAECRSISTEDEEQEFDAREDPDGEETVASGVSQRPSVAQARPPSQLSDVLHKANSVKVPDWISSEAALEVLFNDRATGQLAELTVNRVSNRTIFVGILFNSFSLSSDKHRRRSEDRSALRLPPHPLRISDIYVPIRRSDGHLQIRRQQWNCNCCANQEIREHE